MIDKETLEKYEYYKERLLWLGGEVVPRNTLFFEDQGYISVPITLGKFRDHELQLRLLDIYDEDVAGRLYAAIFKGVWNSGNLIKHFKDFTAPTEEEKILFEIETGGCPYPIMEGWFDGWGK